MKAQILVPLDGSPLAEQALSFREDWERVADRYHGARDQGSLSPIPLVHL